MKMLRKVVFCLLCILFTGTYSILHAQNLTGVNIALNPGFQDDLKDWITWSKGSSWVIQPQGINTPNCAYISHSSYFQASLMQLYGTVTEGIYTLTFNVKMTGTITVAYIELYINNEWVRLPIPQGADWHEVKLPQFFVSWDDRLAIRTWLRAQAGAEFWFDDFNLQLVSEGPLIRNLPDINTVLYPGFEDELSNWCYGNPSSSENVFGRFDIDKDLLLIHHDNYRDVDDIHAIGAHGSMLRDARFANVNYYAVGGTYGNVSGGLWYDVSHLMNLAFGNKWTECHLDWDGSVDLIAAKVENTLKNGGKVWIAEGGQSDFSADVARKVIQNYPEADLKQIHLVQHHPANENMTTPADLEYVIENFSYHFIDKGNNFEADGIALSSWMDSNINNAALWEKVKKDSIIMDLWKEVEVQVEYWLSQEGTLSEGILGRFGFSDTIETTWIFGFNEAGNGTIRLYDCKSFFNEFGALQY